MWSRAKIVCADETYKSVVKLIFAKAPRCPTRPTSSTPDSTAMSAAPIDLREGDELDDSAFKALIRAAVTPRQGEKMGKEHHLLRRNVQ